MAPDAPRRAASSSAPAWDADQPGSEDAPDRAAPPSATRRAFGVAGHEDAQNPYRLYFGTPGGAARPESAQNADRTVPQSPTADGRPGTQGAPNLFAPISVADRITGNTRVRRQRVPTQLLPGSRYDYGLGEPAAAAPSAPPPHADVDALGYRKSVPPAFLARTMPGPAAEQPAPRNATPFSAYREAAAVQAEAIAANRPGADGRMPFPMNGRMDDAAARAEARHPDPPPEQAQPPVTDRAQESPSGRDYVPRHGVSQRAQAAQAVPMVTIRELAQTPEPRVDPWEAMGWKTRETPAFENTAVWRVSDIAMFERGAFEEPLDPLRNPAEPTGRFGASAQKRTPLPFPTAGAPYAPGRYAAGAVVESEAYPRGASQPTGQTSAGNAYVPDAGSLAGGGYATEAGAALGNRPVRDAVLASDGGYAPTADSLSGNGYAPEAGFVSGQAYAPAAGYPADGGYAPAAGYPADGGYAPAAGYPADSSYAPAAGYPADGGYAPAAGYPADGGYAPAGPYPSGSAYSGDGGYPPPPGALFPEGALDPADAFHADPRLPPADSAYPEGNAFGYEDGYPAENAAYPDAAYASEGACSPDAPYLADMAVPPAQPRGGGKGPARRPERRRGLGLSALGPWRTGLIIACSLALVFCLVEVGRIVLSLLRNEED
ncbi:MAG: hypothetical protein GX418_12280, partial [Clostridiales bacterium]|nr:hypothetical protein [Clostridiales bacterium]